MRKLMKDWGKPVLFVVGLYSCAYLVGVAFAQGVSRGGGLIHITVHYSE